MVNNKPILAIETSGSLCGAALYFSDSKYYEVNIQFKNIHAEKIFEAIDYILRSGGVESKDLAAVAVSSGPGSFTGLRIGMSAAKGIAFGASIGIIPVPTFEALAMQVSSMLPVDSVFSVANKINSDEIYFAKFQIIPNNFIFAEDLQIINKGSLREKIAGSGAVFGNAFDENKIAAPSPLFVAKYAVMNMDSINYEFDYLEPNYLKNFIIPTRESKD